MISTLRSLSRIVRLIGAISLINDRTSEMLSPLTQLKTSPKY